MALRSCIEALRENQKTGATKVGRAKKVGSGVTEVGRARKVSEVN